MKSLPIIPKMAYIMAKIINSLIMYTKQELPYKVKSFDLKNALINELDEFFTERKLTLTNYYEGKADNTLLAECDIGEMTEGVREYPVTDKTLVHVSEWARFLCYHGLRRKMVGNLTSLVVLDP